jgi:hypothetical protein
MNSPDPPGAWLEEEGHSLAAPSCASSHQMACGDLGCDASQLTLQANHQMHHDMPLRLYDIYVRHAR